jgi:formamidopyrimidine-DNA glycosylase
MMPELPEVETVRRTLDPWIRDRTIDDVRVFYDGLLRDIKPATFIQRLTGRTCDGIGRYGKYLLFRFGDITLIVHLRMEGKFYIKPEEEPKDKHEHVFFVFKDGMSLRYHDVRKFGTMEIVPRDREMEGQGISSLGPEANSDDFTASYLHGRLKKTRRAVKTALLDQKIVAGLGNIYVDETLYRAGIDPRSKASALNERHAARIVDAAKAVLDKAVVLGGTTIRSYTSSLGVTGRFQNDLMVHMREGKSCKHCGETIVKTKVGGRGTYLCPDCQDIIPTE